MEYENKNNNNGKEGEGENEERKRSENKQYRVVMSEEANTTLMRLVEKANDRFSSGEITKSDIVNFVFSNLKFALSESEIRELRSIHFDATSTLQSLLKSVRRGAELPEGFKNGVRELFNVPVKDKKRALKLESESTGTLNGKP